jgi:protein-S-isoprenylcysteine O-methyltransferase Ste14
MTQEPLPKINHDISTSRLIFKLLFLAAMLIAMLFLSAGRLNWIAAWAFILLYIGNLAIYAIWGLRHDPEQMKERSKTGENTKLWDKIILNIYTFFLILLFITIGLDAGRYHWAPVPILVQIIAWVALIFASIIIWKASMANTYLSRTVRIQTDRNHQVVSHGIYRQVRHPMYSGELLTMLSIPLVLGSLWGLLPAGLIIILFILRTFLEDRTLQAELPGYKEYAQHVRYRLCPGIW